MSNTPINLNKARKARARVAGKVQADENVVRFGLSKAEKNEQKRRAAKAARLLDGHKRDP